jgi:RND family efflux transporter MFP subunit
VRRLGLVLAGFGLVAVGVAAGVVADRQFIPRPEEPTGREAEEHDEHDHDLVTFSTAQQEASGIEVTTVSPAPFVVRSWRPGRIALHQDRIAHVCPRAEGVVREVPVRLGQSVTAGEVLAVIESRELGQAKLEHHKARIALAAERELLTRTRTTMANAGELLELLQAETPLAEIEKQMTNKPIGDWRQQLLGAYTRRNQTKALLSAQRGAGGSVSESNLRKSEAEAEAAAATYTALVEELRFQAKNQIRQAELRFKDAETAVDVARATLVLFGYTPEEVERIDPIAEGATASHLPVRAPFPGVVVEKHAVRSERVDPQTQMFVLVDLAKVWVQCELFEGDLPVLRDHGDRPVVFRSGAAKVPERPARLVYSGDLIDRNSRTITLTAEADNPDRLLKPGLFVEVGLEAGGPEPAIQVPATAILRHENRPFVFVQTADDQYRRTEVILGRSAEDRVEVTAGLKPGDRVVIRGGFVLKSELFKDLMVGE